MTDNKNQENIMESEYQEDELEETVEQVSEKKKPRKARKKRMTRKKKRNILMISVLVLAAIGALYYFNNHQAAKNKELQTSEFIDENSYTGSNIMRVDLNQINKINIDLKTADVRIQRSTTNPYIEYTHLYKGEEDIYTVDVSYENGVLNLKSNIQGKELNMKNKIQIVRIFLPNDKPVEEIKAKIGAGDVKITDLEVKDLDLNVKSGHISFDNSFFGGFVTNEAGDITLTNTELMNTKLATNAGDISIEEGKIGSRSDFSTQSGNITIKSTDTIDNYNVKASLEVGNFILGNISKRKNKNGLIKKKKKKKEMSLKTRVGNIIFNKGEGAILDEEEYITNKSNKEEKEESKYDYINVEDDEDTDEEKSDDGNETDTTDENQSEGEENNN